ncbi:MAG: hypothetical protein AAGJ80_10225, partial [Cyanobacteria bacterium J06553_1]
PFTSAHLPTALLAVKRFMRGKRGRMRHNRRPKDFQLQNYLSEKAAFCGALACIAALSCSPMAKRKVMQRLSKISNVCLQYQKS